jgi:hypothetical protein
VYFAVQKIVEPDPIILIAHAGCDRCGSFDTHEIGDHMLCADCVILAASSCAGCEMTPVAE